MTARTCPYAGCGKTITPTLFACSKHWFTLPGAIRDEIWHAWRAYDRGNGTLLALTAAQEKALAHWGQA